MKYMNLVGRLLALVMACAGNGCKSPIRPPEPGPTPLPDLRQRRIEVLKANDAAREALIQSQVFTEIPLEASCRVPRPVTLSQIDPDRSLFVHDVATLTAADFSLRRTLTQLANQANDAGATVTAETLFRDLWDTQNPLESAADPGGVHCQAGGVPATLNGFPVSCRPGEGAQAKAADLAAELDKYVPVGLVNRIDLAGDGWRNCGEHRIVYGRQGAGIGKNFIIFEAVLPNPRPGCKSSCRRVAAFWQSLSNIAEPELRASALADFFYQGLPGFDPVVHIDHYTALPGEGFYGAAGSGQIRTNQFLQQPWLLKEFKLALDCSAGACELAVVPIPVGLNPHGSLWNQNNTAAATLDFQGDVLGQVATLAVNDVNGFGYAVDGAHNAGESNAQQAGPPDNYRAVYQQGPGGSFGAALGALAAGQGLTDVNLVNRALALSCAGCHQPATFGLLASGALGGGITWPNSRNFVHVDVTVEGGRHPLSPALTDVFLPARRSFLQELLNDPICVCKPRRFIPQLPPLENQVLIPQLPERVRLFEQMVGGGQGGPRAVAVALDRLVALDTEANRAMVEEGRRQGVKVPALAPTDAGPRRLRLDTLRETDPARRAQLRAQWVQAQVRAALARRTVTGHFRTH